MPRPWPVFNGMTFAAWQLMLTLLMAGDVMLGRGVSQALQRMHPEEPWEDLLPHFRRADFRLVNLEAPLTHHKTRWSRTQKIFHFRAEPLPALLTLRGAHIDACSLANNHLLDFEIEGLLDTLKYLGNERIAFAGAGQDIDHAQAPRIITLAKENAKIALLSATDNEPAFAAGPNTPGVNYFPIDLDATSLAWLDRGVEESRRAGAQIIILSLHWGPNMVERPPSVFQRFAHAAIDRGVDVIHGHSAHIFQGVEFYRGKPILYDCGDLIDDYVVDPLLRNDWSFLYSLDFDDATFRELRLIPVQLGYGRARLAREPERELILERMVALSRDLGTRLERDGEYLRLRNKASRVA